MHDISSALVQHLRPFERRPVPEGRKFRRWRQPERLFERAQRASFIPSAEGWQILGWSDGAAALSFASFSFRQARKENEGTMESHSKNGNSRKCVSTYGISLWVRSSCAESSLRHAPAPVCAKLAHRKGSLHRLRRFPFRRRRVSLLISRKKNREGENPSLFSCA